MRAIAHAEFRVEDAGKAADLLVAGYGFRVAPPDPGSAHGTLLVNGGVRLLLLEPGDAGPTAGYVARHGDGVAGVAVVCDDADEAFRRAVAAGARVVAGPERVIEVFDDFTLRFVPDGAAADAAPPTEAGLFDTIDHVAVCVPHGSLGPTVDFCERALGLRRVFGEFIEVGSQAMDSVVVASAGGTVAFTLLEPCPDREPGQIDAFLAAHAGPGVQHLALRTADIATAVRTLGARGVEFLTTPAAYYAGLERRLGPTGIPVEELRELNVLVDQDHGGQLFQIFTRSVHPRRTFFFELIERRGAATFGTANIRALYEAVERQTIAAER